MICKKCGASVLDDSKFCGQCGAKIENTAKCSLQETLCVKDIPQPSAEAAKKDSAEIIVPRGLARHEEATKEPLFSPMGLFSTYGRRNRIDTLKMIFLQVLVCVVAALIIPILPFFVSYWFEITNAFKRLQDLDKPKSWKIIFVILSIITWFPIIFFAITLPFHTSLKMENIYMLLWGISMLVHLYLLLAPGTKGANRYGRSPEELKHISK